MTEPLQDITIRRMDIADYGQVYALWMGTPGMGLNNVDDSREGIARYLQRNPATSFVAEDTGGIVGVILCGHDGRRGVIHHTAVRKDLQGQGVGKALVTAAFAALRAEGITKAWLVVKKYNGHGAAFWQRIGFDLRDDLHFMGFTLDTTLTNINT